MPIIIKELIASDRISNFTDKINHNFDQILLNGGGPQGPQGPMGPQGPIGTRGIRGSLWFEDPIGTIPSNLEFEELYEGDNYLQQNGDVWNWDNSNWINTGINLKGPQGEAGEAIGLDYFGSNLPDLPRFKNSIYPSIFNGVATGANNSNEGVSSMVIGGSISIDNLYPGSDGYSIIPDEIAKNIDSLNTSLFIHQKKTGTKSIRFHGESVNNNYYEQDDINKLASISLNPDDSLSIDTNKEPQNPQGDLIGLSINTQYRGQRYRAGKGISFITGTYQNALNGSIPDNADFNVSVNNYPNIGINPKILLNVRKYGNSVENVGASLRIGSGTNIPNSVSNQYDGNIIGQSNKITLLGNLIKLQSNQNNKITSNINTGININSDNLININSTAGSNIILNSDFNTQVTSNNKIVLITENNTSTIDISTPHIRVSNAITIGSAIPGNTTNPPTATFNGEVYLNETEESVDDNKVLVKNSTNNKVEEMPPGGPLMPIGGIIMWSGEDEDDIPDGWALCNGSISNGVQTPDLRGKFIVGKDSGDISGNDPFNEIGNNGGVKRVQLDKDELPSHDHTGPLLDGRSFDRLAGVQTHGDPPTFTLNGASYSEFTVNSPHDPGINPGNPELFIRLTDDLAEASKIKSVGTDQSHQNLPPYYVLAYIIYVGV